MTNSPIEKYLEDIYKRFIKNNDGQLADYIPELATVDPDRFGLVLATADGQVYKYGDTSDEFTIQSISKPFTYGLAISDNGFDYVDRKIDVEASGDAYNEISLDADTHRPKNAMINAGAITSTSLIRAASSEERYERIREFFSKFAARDLSLDQAVYNSELETGHRNRAIAWMLKNFDIIEGNPEEVIRSYFEQCSTLVSTEDLAIMGATLANNGVNPISGEEILDSSIVERILSVMMTAGMYDGAGDWMTSVGIPAKSGVGGGILGVLPGQLAIAVFSPLLDRHGSSARGVAAFETISSDLNLHIMNVNKSASSVIKSIYTIDERPSILRRTTDEEEVLDKYGYKAKVIEAEGDILFSGAETLIRESMKDADDIDIFIYDNTLVKSITDGNEEDIVRKMMYEVGEEKLAQGKRVVIVDPSGRYLDNNTNEDIKVFKSTESALQWAEEKILKKYSDPDVNTSSSIVPINDFEFFTNFDEEQIKDFVNLLKPLSYKNGDKIASVGDENKGIYFITKGKVTASKKEGNNSQNYRRITILIAGMTFGEIALASGDKAKFDIWCQADTELLYLSKDAINKMTIENPSLAAAMWKAIALDGYSLFDRTLRQLSSRVEQEEI